MASLRDYVGKWVSMADCPAFRQLGYDCGSGPAESQCVMLTDRLQDSGMRWDADNADRMMALAGVYNSGLWSDYSDSQRASA